MRPDVDAARLRALAREFGRHATQHVRMYVTGGASAVLVGWRASTMDVDLRLEPEDPGILDAIPAAKERIPINLEFASPPDFVPEVPGWRERSVYAFREGPVDVYHFDFYSQALAKLERAHEMDLLDVEAMAKEGLIDRRRLLTMLGAMGPELRRYPAIDSAAFRARVEAFGRG